MDLNSWYGSVRSAEDTQIQKKHLFQATGRDAGLTNIVWALHSLVDVHLFYMIGSPALLSLKKIQM